jgi:SAM-dependent methyltransferase
MFSFDAVADEYDAGRPDHPEALFDELEPLAGARVLEGGAGTGIATRALLLRGARVFPFDVGAGVLRKAIQRSPGLPAVVADGTVLPFRDRSADLICFAQSWHWLDEQQGWEESARVLRAEGRWAAWWSLAFAEGEDWFDAYWGAVEAATVARREQRGFDTGESVRRSGLFEVSARVVVPWVRDVSVERWLIEESSKSFIAALSEPDRGSLLREIERIAHDGFPSGEMRIPYETRLWTATKI